MDFVLKQMQMIMCDLSANWNSSYHELEQRIISMEQKLDELGRSFQSTSELLTQALHRRRLDHRYTVQKRNKQIIRVRFTRKTISIFLLQNFMFTIQCCLPFLCNYL